MMFNRSAQSKEREAVLKERGNTGDTCLRWCLRRVPRSYLSLVVLRVLGLSERIFWWCSGACLTFLKQHEQESTLAHVHPILSHPHTSPTDVREGANPIAVFLPMFPGHLERHICGSV